MKADSFRPRRDFDPDAEKDIEEGFAMANIHSEDTGLPFIVYVSQGTGSRHAARIKISPNPVYRRDRTISVRLHDFTVDGDAFKLSAEDMEKLKRWVALNKETILDYWDGTLTSTKEMLNRIKPI